VRLWDQRLHAIGFALWSRRLTWAYRWGILALLAAVTIMLVPPGHISVMRWVAIAAATFGWILEAAWIASGWLLKGSPVAVFGDEPDVPKAGTPALAIRGSRPLRAVARTFNPLPRLTFEEPAKNPTAANSSN